MIKRYIMDLPESKIENVVFETEFAFEDKINRRVSKIKLRSILDALSVKDILQYLESRKPEYDINLTVKVKP